MSRCGEVDVSNRKGWVVVESFLGLLNYEIRCSARWRRYASLLVVDSVDGGEATERFREIIKADMRKCDEMAWLDGGKLAILMPETNGKGLRQAVRRYGQKYDGWLDVRFGAASFPQDAQEGRDLFRKACERLDRAKQLDPRTVVSEG